jgi:uncharacterized protein YlxW (UPF0749 family)
MHLFEYETQVTAVSSIIRERLEREREREREGERERERLRERVNDLQQTLKRMQHRNGTNKSKSNNYITII